MVKIVAETALFDRAVQVAIGRGNDPDIDVDRPNAADPVELAFLK